MKKRFAIVFSAIALSACTRTLDPAAIESEIQADLTRQAKIPIRSIACPADIKSEVGQTFECVGALNPDGGFFITVKQKDDQGNISWQVPNSWRLLNLSSLASEFQKTLGTSIEVNCGEGYRPTKAGDSFECKLNGRSPTDTILVKVERT